MIISDRPGKFTCPHCGGGKNVLAILSGNTCRGEVWSDSRHYYPMMPQYSPIQKCPECGRYFFKKDGNFKMVDSVTVDGKVIEFETERFISSLYDDSPAVPPTPEEIERDRIRVYYNKKASKNRFGELSYQELAEAEKDVLTEGVSAEREKTYLMTFIFAYNDARYGRAGTPKQEIPANDQDLFRRIAFRLVHLQNGDTILAAELWRELGEFDKSAAICGRLFSAGENPDVVRQILERAERHDPEVFQIEFPQNQ